jgi:MFS family permease
MRQYEGQFCTPNNIRALLGIGMGAEWPAGAALAMEQWPARSRGLMSGILQGSWGLGFLLSSAMYGLFYDYLGWRGMLWIGIVPALSVVYIRYFVKEPEVWVESRKRQRVEHRQVRAPLLSIFKRGMLSSTLTACWWMASGFVVYYSVTALFATHLQKDLNLSPALVAAPIAIANFVVFLAMGFGGGSHWATMVDDHSHRDDCACGPLLPAHERLHLDLCRLRPWGLVPHLQPVPELPRRTLPHGSARHRECLLLPPGRDLRRSSSSIPWN